MGNTATRIYLVAVPAMLICSIAFLVSTELHRRKITRESPVTSQVCVTCDLLPSGPESQVLTRRVQDGRERCCALDVDQVSILMILISRKESKKPAEPVEFEPRHVSAHKQVMIVKHLLNSTELSNETNVHLGLDPNDNDHWRQHASNVNVLPTGYQILVSGTYHIYSSIDFRAYNSKPCQEYSLKTWRQAVVRSRANQRHASGVLLTSAHTCCDDCVRDKETSYTAGTFLLQAGDHLHMEVSGLQLVNFETESSFFGLTMLADTPPTSGLADQTPIHYNNQSTSISELAQ